MVLYAGVRYPLTHDLEDLYNLLEESQADVSPFADLAEFTPFAVELRYDPDAWEFQPLDRAELTLRVRLLLNHVTAILSE